MCSGNTTARALSPVKASVVMTEGDLWRTIATSRIKEKKLRGEYESGNSLDMYACITTTYMVKRKPGYLCFAGVREINSSSSSYTCIVIEKHSKRKEKERCGMWLEVRKNVIVFEGYLQTPTPSCRARSG
jgi:hypothetical protein